MSARPTVAVVMAVRNASRFLRTALESIQRQTYAPAEVILVDGRSTDDTEAIARRVLPGVIFLQETSRGFAAAWNDGIRASRSELIAILSADDRWSDDKLQRQVDALIAEPSAGFAIGHARFVAEPGATLPSNFKPELLERSHVAYMPEALMARRTLFDDVGFFDASWTIASDVDWFARVKDRGIHPAIVPDVVVYKRIHDQNLLHTTATASPVINTEMLQLLRASIHRQRAGGTGGGGSSEDPKR